MIVLMSSEVNLWF